MAATSQGQIRYQSPAAIATMAFEHHDRLSSNFVTDRAAGTAAGERNFDFRHYVFLDTKDKGPSGFKEFVLL